MDVRRGDDRLRAVGGGRPAERDGFLPVRRPVVDARQAMEVNVDQVRAPPL
jgi:hypothetical protein